MTTTDRLDVAVHAVRTDVVVRLAPAAAAAAQTTPDQVLRRWLEGANPIVRRRYGRCLADFASWATGAPSDAETAWRVLLQAGVGPAHQMVRLWRDELLQRGLATGTVAGMVSCLGALVRAGREAGLVSWSLERCGPKVEPRHDRRGPVRHEVEQLVASIEAQADAGDELAARDVALVRLLHNAALRVSEALQIDVADVDLGDQPAVTVRRKGRRERQRVTIGDLAADSLRRWLQVRGDDAGPVFCRIRQAADRSSRLSPEMVRKMLRSRGADVGIRSAVRPHGLRHSSATEVLRRGSIVELQALGGWRTLSAASHYVDLTAATRHRAVALVEV